MAEGKSGVAEGWQDAGRLSYIHAHIDGVAVAHSSSFHPPWRSQGIPPARHQTQSRPSDGPQPAAHSLDSTSDHWQHRRRTHAGRQQQLAKSIRRRTGENTNTKSKRRSPTSTSQAGKRQDNQTMASASEEIHPSVVEYQGGEVDGGHSSFVADILSTPDQRSLGPHATGGLQFLDTQPTNALSTTNSTSLAPTTARPEWEQEDDERQPHQQGQDQDPCHSHDPLQQQGPHLTAAAGHEHPSVLGQTAGTFSLAAAPLPAGHPWQQYQQHQLDWPAAGVAVNGASLGLSGDGAGAYMPHGDVDPSLQPNVFVRGGHGHGGAGGVVSASSSSSVAATASFGSLASQHDAGVFDNQTAGAFFTSHHGWAMQVGQAQAQEHHFGQQPITYQPGLAATLFPYQHQHAQQSQQGQQQPLPADPSAAFAAGGYQPQLYYQPSQPQGQGHHTSRPAQSSHLVHHIAQPLEPGIAFPASGNLTMERRGGRSDTGAGGGCNSSPSSPEHLPGHNPFDILPAQGLPSFKSETAQNHHQQLDAAGKEQAFPQICWPTTPPPSRGQWPVDGAQLADGVMFPHHHQMPMYDGLPTDIWYSRAAAGSQTAATTVSPKDIRFPPPVAPDEPFRANLFGGGAHDGDGPFVLDARADPSKLYLDRASPSLPMSEWPPQQQPAAYQPDPALLEMHNDLFYQIMGEGGDAVGSSNTKSAVDETRRPTSGGTSSSPAKQKKPSRGHQKRDAASQKRKELPAEEPTGRRGSAIPDLRPGGGGATAGRRASLPRQDAAAGNKPKRRSGVGVGVGVVDSHAQQHYQGAWEIQPIQAMPSASPYPQQQQREEGPNTTVMAAAPPPPFIPVAATPLPTTTAAPAEGAQGTPQRRTTRRRRDPDTPPDSADDDDVATAAAGNQVLPAGASKRAQDEFLVRMRRQGVPYKTILANGNFEVEEATLRTRHRSLVKRPEERPRVPEWTAVDDKLLERIVMEMMKDHKRDRALIPWAKVGPYIKRSGGTHEFGPQACHKRWDELVAISKARGSSTDQKKQGGGRNQRSR
ncbi:hypothetical protein RB593_001675 [Gaeumannomyces tritici]